MCTYTCAHPSHTNRDTLSPTTNVNVRIPVHFSLRYTSKHSLPDVQQVVESQFSVAFMVRLSPMLFKIFDFQMNNSISVFAGNRHWNITLCESIVCVRFLCVFHIARCRTFAFYLFSQVHAGAILIRIAMNNRTRIQSLYSLLENKDVSW